MRSLSLAVDSPFERHFAFSESNPPVNLRGEAVRQLQLGSFDGFMVSSEEEGGSDRGDGSIDFAGTNDFCGQI
jgi:hypothetical protein